MKKIKTTIQSLFQTPRKRAITILCIIAALTILGVTTVFAANAIAQSTSIGEENAKNYAYADAGVDPVSAQNVHVEFDFEQGQFVYEVEFTADNTEYEYWIKASDGSVVKKSLELTALDGTGTTATAAITTEEATNIALSDAGLSESEVTFTEQKLDTDDGISVYDIEFYTASAAYEYEINAATGDIYSKSTERFAAAATEAAPASASDSAAATTTPASGSDPTAATTAPASGSDSAAATSVPASGSNSTAATGAPASDQAQNNSSATYIGVDKAKSIAAEHAGFSVSEITFSKAKLENDDGITVYEVEFYKNGMEYEYTIDASAGTILEYEADWDD